MDKRIFPQIKICGLTRVDEAVGCVERGADAIGLVFFPKSPRHVTDSRALDISTAVSGKVKTVGVFVNADYDEIMRRVDACRLSMVQLHGQEPPDLVRRLSDMGLQVVKALFVNGIPSLAEGDHYPASAFLVECGKGILPGGNALTWNWRSAKNFGLKHPLILAGGLSSENIFEAVSDALPLAVDISSGVEHSPGRKDLQKVTAFIAAVKKCRHLLVNEERKTSVF